MLFYYLYYLFGSNIAPYLSDVAIKIIDSVQFFVNGGMVDSVKLYATDTWGGQTFANSMPFEVTQ